MFKPNQIQYCFDCGFKILTSKRTERCPICENYLSNGAEDRHSASCDECDKKISSESKFCRYCGSPVPNVIAASLARWTKKYEYQNQYLPESIKPDMSQTMPCPHCADGWGYKMGRADQTCFECGQKIGKWEYKKDRYELHAEEIKREYQGERIKFALIAIIVIIIYIFLMKKFAAQFF